MGKSEDDTRARPWKSTHRHRLQFGRQTPRPFGQNVSSAFLKIRVYTYSNSRIYEYATIRMHEPRIRTDTTGTTVIRRDCSPGIGHSYSNIREFEQAPKTYIRIGVLHDCPVLHVLGVLPACSALLVYVVLCVCSSHSSTRIVALQVADSKVPLPTNHRKPNSGRERIERQLSTFRVWLLSTQRRTSPFV